VDPPSPVKREMAIIERVLIAITEVVAILVAVSAWVNRRMVTHPVTTAPIGGVTLFALWALVSWLSGAPAWEWAGWAAAGLTIALWSRTAYLVSVHRRRRRAQPERG
jgi:hypothetical protein